MGTIKDRTIIGDPRVTFLSVRTGLYVQDDIKLTRNLTLIALAGWLALHGAVALLVSVFLWPLVRRRWRPLLALYPLAMGFTLVLGGDHYVFDILLGWAVSFGARGLYWYTLFVAIAFHIRVVIAEEPRIGPYRERIREAIAALLHDAVELPEHVLLHVHALEHRLDDDVGVLQRVEVGGRDEQELELHGSPSVPRLGGLLPPENRLGGEHVFVVDDRRPAIGLDRERRPQQTRRFGRRERSAAVPGLGWCRLPAALLALTGRRYTGHSELLFSGGGCDGSATPSPASPRPAGSATAVTSPNRVVP